MANERLLQTFFLFLNSYFYWVLDNTIFSERGNIYSDDQLKTLLDRIWFRESHRFIKKSILNTSNLRYTADR